MGDARIGRFLVLVAPLLFGLLAMHAFVAPAGGEHGAGHGGAGGAAVHDVAATPSVSGSEPLPPAHDAAGSPAHAPPAAVAVPGSVVAEPAVPDPAVPHAEGDGVPGGHHGVDHLVHLCLAVLAAVGLAVAVAWVLLGTVVPSVAASVRRRVASAPAGRPPPVPRRLAALCVMRN